MQSFFQKFTAVMSKLLGTRYSEGAGYGYECVAFAKKFSQEMYGVKLGSFGGMAINGWDTGSPFTAPGWKRIVYKKGLVPSAGDIVFFAATPQDKPGHVAVADGACTKDTLSVDEQNALLGNGSGIGGDAITHRNVPYTAK